MFIHLVVVMQNVGGRCSRFETGREQMFQFFISNVGIADHFYNKERRCGMITKEAILHKRSAFLFFLNAV